jgi:hypothetical protein
MLIIIQREDIINIVRDNLLTIYYIFELLYKITFMFISQKALI